MKNLILMLFVLSFPLFVAGQLSTLYLGDNNIDQTAIVQFDATDKGILVPRMSSTERDNIVNPKDGSLVFDLNTDSFWFFDDTNWVEIYAASEAENRFYDGDGDTGINLELGGDHDKIESEASGVSVFEMENDLFRIDKDINLVFNNSMVNASQGLYFSQLTNSLNVGSTSALSTIDWGGAAVGINSFSAGFNNDITGRNGFSIGKENIILGINGAAFGLENEVNGVRGTAMGLGNISSLISSFARGNQTVAAQFAATSWGISTQASMNRSTAWGNGAICDGIGSTAFGESINNFDNSTTWGLSVSQAQWTSSWGYGAISSVGGQSTCGTHNIVYAQLFNDQDRLFVIGNGSDAANKSNVFEVNKANETRFIGNLNLKSNVTSTIFGLKEETNGILYGFEFDYNQTTERLLLRSRNFSGNDATRMTFGPLGKVGLGRIGITNKFEISGNASKSIAGPWTGNSDRRLKKNIQYFDDDEILQKVLEMRGVRYEWNDDQTENIRPTEVQMGFIAQDLQKIWPEYVSEDNQGYLQTAYGDYDAIFVEAFQAQQNSIDEIRSSNEEMSNKNKEAAALNQLLEETLVNLEKEVANLKRE